MIGVEPCNCCGAMVDDYTFEITDGYCLPCDSDRIKPTEVEREEDAAQVNLRG